MMAFGQNQIPDRRTWAVEGCGSYRAGLAAFLLAEGETVVEVERPARPRRRAQAKSDPLDAARAAREALGTETHQLAEPKQGPAREALRVVMAARASVIEARKAALNLLHNLRTTAPGEIREHLRTHSGKNLLNACTVLPEHIGAAADDAVRATAATLARLAARIHALAAEEADYDRQLRDLVTRLAPSIVASPAPDPYLPLR